jgi:hypothetical protein
MNAKTRRAVKKAKAAGSKYRHAFDAVVLNMMDVNFRTYDGAWLGILDIMSLDEKLDFTRWLIDVADIDNEIDLRKWLAVQEDGAEPQDT